MEETQDESDDSKESNNESDEESVDESEDESNDSIDYDTDDDSDYGIKDGLNWFMKSKCSIDHVNEFSRKYCVHPGFAVSIDEMMKLFKGRSNMTFRMKCKPIKEGFKFYAMCDAGTGFIYFFLPDGLKEKKKKTIAEKVAQMVRRLPQRKEKQYIAVMDNYFTWPKTIIGNRKLGVATMGTAQNR